MTRATLWLMIPVNLLLCGWVWIGRLVFGVGGWFMLILIPAVLVLLVMLLVTTVLALTQEGSQLTGAQTAAQLVLWAGLLVLGAVMPDFGDTDDSTRSLLTQVFGYSDSLYDASFGLALAAAVVSVVSWVVLLVTVTAGRRRVGA